MRRLGFIAACAILVGAGAAHAANPSIEATGKNTSGQIVRSPGSDGTTTYANGVPNGTWEVSGQGGTFQSVVTTGPSHISFQSGTATSGNYAFASASSSVDVKVTNDTSDVLQVNSFGSSIISAGLGFYLQDRDGPLSLPNVFTGYGQQTGEGIQSFQALDPSATLLGGAGFNFTITGDGYDEPLYQLSGSIGLFETEGGIIPIYQLANARETLKNFTGLYGTPTNGTGFGNDGMVYAFGWDATDISVILGQILNPTDSLTLHYSAEVNTFTRSDCVGGGTSTCLVAYSGFGDPIGRGGGVDSLALQAFDLGGTIKDIVFNPVTVDPVTFRRGDVTVLGSGTPEPATWAMMILGFGAAGAALRRRKVALAA